MLVYFIGMLLCILCLLFLWVCTDCKAYIVHILLFISAFIPIWSFIATFTFILAIIFLICEEFVELKNNKITKFLFGIDEEE